MGQGSHRDPTLRFGCSDLRQINYLVYNVKVRFVETTWALRILGPTFRLILYTFNFLEKKSRVWKQFLDQTVILLLTYCLSLGAPKLGV